MVEQAAQRHGVTDKAGQDQREQGGGHDVKTGIAQIILRRIKGRKHLDPDAGCSQMLQVFQPITVFRRIRRNGKQDYKNIQQCSRQHRNAQNAEGMLPVKLKLPAGVGYIFKPDEGPGCNQGDSHHLGKDILLRDEGRLQGKDGRIPVEQRRYQAERDARSERQRQQHHQAYRMPFPLHTQETRQQDDPHGQDDFPRIDLIIKHRVQISELQHIAEKVTDKDRNRRSIGPQHRQIGQPHVPETQEGAIVTEHFLYIGVHAAGCREFIHQVMIIVADEQHDNHSCQHAQRASHRPGLFQIQSCSKQEGAPSDRRTHRQRPCPYRRQIRLKPLFAFFN